MSSSARLLVATRDFFGDASRGQLSFSAGAEIVVLPWGGNGPRGWRLGKCANRRGWFPAHAAARGSERTRAGLPPSSPRSSHYPFGETTNRPPPQNRRKGHHQRTSPRPNGAAASPGKDSRKHHSFSSRGASITTTTSTQTATTTTVATTATTTPSQRSRMAGALAALSRLQQEIEALEERALDPLVRAELVTRVCCRLDAVDVHGSRFLRSQRRALLRRAELLDPPALPPAQPQQHPPCT